MYVLPSLVNGKYRLTCTLDGFAPVARDLELRSGDRLRVDLTLTIGGITEETRVVAETPLLETATATRSQVIDQGTIESLPLAGRNPYSAAYTIAGVTTQFTRASISARPFDNGGMDAISINGGRNRSNELLLDGAPNTSREGTSQGSLAFVPSPDAVQEVRVSTNTYDAQFGRTGGGVIAVSIRSGTNTFRGTAYYNMRDAALNSNLYENTVRGIPKDELFHYNPGFTVGGPVLLPKYDGRNRTFFFYAFEGLKSGIPVSAGQRAPTDLERAGNFSQSGMTIYDPLNTINGVPQPFPGNIIPTNRIDPVAANLMQFMVSPNSNPDAQGNNYLPAQQLAVRHLHFRHHPGGSQLQQQPPLLLPLRPQRPPRDARQGRPGRAGAHRRLPSPLEQRVERGPQLDARPEPALEPARRVDPPSPAGHQRRRRHGWLRSRDHGIPGLVRLAGAGPLLSDPHQRLRRGVDRSGRRPGWPER